MHPNELTLEKLAARMHMTVRALCSASKQVATGFSPAKQRYFPKKRKHRQIRAPRRDVKRFLRRIHKALQGMISWNVNVHNGPRRKSCFTAARSHVGNSSFVVRDISKCYPSITAEMLMASLTDLGVSRGIARFLVRVGIVDRQVAQGSPLSCTILNLYLWRTDDQLSHAATERSAQYSRYADDMISSTRRAGDCQGFGALIERELKQKGLAVSSKKNIDKSVNKGDIVVLGLKLNNPQGTACSEVLREQAIALADSYARGCAVACPDSLVPLARKRAQLEGLMHHMRQITFSPARHIRQKLSLGDRRVLQRLKAAQVSCARGKWWLHPPSKRTTSNRPSPCVALAAAWRARVGFGSIGRPKMAG